MSDSYDPYSVRLNAIDDGMREFGQDEMAEAEFSFLTDFVVGGD